MSIQTMTTASENTAANALKIDPPAQASFLKRSLSAFRNTPRKFKVGLTIIIFIVLLAIIGPFVRPYNPNANILSVNNNQPPSASHWFGTDNSGEDELSEILVGTWPTVITSLLVGLGVIVIGVTIGLVAGYYGGYVDQILSFITNIFLVIPALPLLIITLHFSPSGGGVLLMSFVLIIFGWAWTAKVIRPQVMSLRNQEFVMAAKETGESNFRIMTVEILPRMVSLIASGFIFTVIYAVTASTGLMFLGLGLGGASTTSLGSVLFNASNNDALVNNWWWQYIPASLLIGIFGMGLVLMNYGLDEIGNPRLRDANRFGKLGRKTMRPADPTPVLALSSLQKKSFWSQIVSKSSPKLDIAQSSESKG